MTRRTPRVLRENGLSLFFGAIFLAAVVGQAASGLALVNREQVAADLDPLTLGQYVTSSAFLVDLTENWQSEFLQFFLFIAATIWFVQKGSPESKKPGDEGPGSDADQLVGPHARPDSPRWARAGGWRAAVFGNSLLIVMGAVFVLSWFAQSLAGTVVMNEENAMHGVAAITWADYVTSSDFWDRTLQNWQSEFLAVLCMVVFAIYLRERGSPESKPVGAPHGATGVES